FTKLSVILTFTWPPKNNQFWFRALMCINILLSLLLIWPLVLSIIKYRNNLLIVIKSVIVIGGLSNYYIIVVRIYQKELQQLNSSLEEFVANANANERKTLQKYINKCWKFQFFLTCCIFVMVTAFTVGPAWLPQKFPSDAIYPFSVEHPIVAGIVYMHQCLIAYQSFEGMVLDCQAALFIWFISVKFDLNSISLHSKIPKFVEVINFNLIFLLIFIRYAKIMIAPTRILALFTVFITKLGIIISGIFLISNTLLAVKIQFGLMALSMIINLYVCIWPANYLLTISSKSLSDEIFGLTWKHDSKTRVLWTIVLRQAQKPVAINVPGLLDTLSNEYYSTLFSAAFSAFATIRVAVAVNA
ncbi:GSCOCT00002937001.3-RA-CDS, partial [Cotesia congregata]